MNKKFIVTACRDFIEGYGPMHLQRIFNTYEEAYDFIQGKDGIYGTKQHEKPTVYEKENYGTEELFNGYVLTIMVNDILIKKLKEIKEEDKNFELKYVDGYWIPTTKEIIFQY